MNHQLESHFKRIMESSHEETNDLMIQLSLVIERALMHTWDDDLAAIFENKALFSTQISEKDFFYIVSNLGILLTKSDSRIRTSAAWILGKIGTKESLDLLVNYLHLNSSVLDSTPFERAEVLIAIQKHTSSFKEGARSIPEDTIKILRLYLSNTSKFDCEERATVTSICNAIR